MGVRFALCVLGGFPQTGNVYFRRAADGRPYERAKPVRIAFRRTVGAPIGRPFSSYALRAVFRRPAMFIFGGRPMAAPTRGLNLCGSLSGAP